VSSHLSFSVNLIARQMLVRAWHSLFLGSVIGIPISELLVNIEWTHRNAVRIILHLQSPTYCMSSCIVLMSYAVDLQDPKSRLFVPKQKLLHRFLRVVRKLLLGSFVDAEDFFPLWNLYLTVTVLLFVEIFYSSYNTVQRHQMPVSSCNSVNSLDISWTHWRFYRYLSFYG